MDSNLKLVVAIGIFVFVREGMISVVVCERDSNEVVVADFDRKLVESIGLYVCVEDAMIETVEGVVKEVEGRIVVMDTIFHMILLISKG